MATTKEIIQLIIQGKDLSSDELKKVNNNLESVSSTMLKVGAASTAVGVAIVAGLTPAIKIASDLEDEITNALTLVSTQGQEFEEMSMGMESLALRLSRSLGQSATTVASGFYQVLSSGAQALTPEFEALTETSLKLAEVVGLDVPFAVESLSDTLNAFKAPLTEATRFADVFFTTSKLAATTVPQLTRAMREAAPVAGGLSQTLEDTAAVLAGFASVGFKAGIAGTSFRIILNKLATGSGEAAQALKDLGVNAFDPLTGNMRPIIEILRDIQTGMAGMTDEQRAMTLKALAGEEAFAKLGAVLGLNMDVLEDWSEELKKGGALEEAFEKKSKTLTKQIGFLKAELGAAGIEIGNVLLPAVVQAVQVATRAASVFTRWAGDNDALIQSVAQIGVALIGAGGLFFSIGAITKAIAIMRIGALAAFGPGGWIMLAVAGLSILATKAYADIITLGNALGNLPDIKQIRIEIDTVGEGKFADKLRGDIAEVNRALDKFKDAMEERDFVDKYAADIDNLDERFRKLAYADPAAAIREIESGFAGLRVEQEKVVSLKKMIQETSDLADQVERFVAAYSAVPIEAIIPVQLTFGDPEAVRKAIKQNIEDADIDWDDIEIPPLIMHFAIEDKEVQTAIYAVGNMWNAGLQRMLVAGNTWRQSINAMWRTLASDVIAYISSMIAKWLVFKAIKMMAGGPLGFLASSGGVVTASGGGVVALPSTGVIGAQSGGVIVGAGASTLRDNVPIMAQGGEAFLDQTLTNDLRESLSSGGGPGQGGDINIFVGRMVATASEAKRFARTTRREADKYEDRYIAEAGR